jgi:hypothetical protein
LHTRLTTSKYPACRAGLPNAQFLAITCCL